MSKHHITATNILEDQNDHKDSNSNDYTNDSGYFQYYSLITNQQNMLQDYVRTSTYYNAITQSLGFFNNKLVLDVGAGSGILSYFSVQAGASKVYMVEASNIANYIKIVIDQANKAISNATLKNKLRLIHKKIEDVNLTTDLDSNKVDIIVSEPIGVFVVHERMIESYILARDRFLKKGGRLIPNKAKFYIELISDNKVWVDTYSKTLFYENTDFYNIDLNAMKNKAKREIFAMPIVGYINANTLINKKIDSVHTFDFEKMSVEDLYNIRLKKRCEMEATAIVHGLAGWFDILFPYLTSNNIDIRDSTSEEDNSVKISTAPFSQPTHWQQIRFLLSEPIAVNKGQIVEVEFDMKVNQFRSYDIKGNIKVYSRQNDLIEQKEMFWRLSDQCFNFSNNTNTVDNNEYPEYHHIYNANNKSENINGRNIGIGFRNDEVDVNASSNVDLANLSNYYNQ